MDIYTQWANGTKMTPCARWLVIPLTSTYYVCTYSANYVNQQRERERERERQTDRQTDRQTEIIIWAINIINITCVEYGNNYFEDCSHAIFIIEKIFEGQKTAVTIGYGIWQYSPSTDSCIHLF